MTFNPNKYLLPGAALEDEDEEQQDSTFDPAKYLKKGLDPTVKTNPLTGEVVKETGNPLETFIRRTAAGAANQLGPIGETLHIPGAEKLTEMGEVLYQATPQEDPAHRASGFAGDVAGTLLGSAGILRGLNYGLGALAKFTGIAPRMVELATNVSQNFAKPGTQAFVKGALTTGLHEAAVGVTYQGIHTPESLTTPQGIAMAAGFAGFDTVIGGALSQLKLLKETGRAEDLARVEDTVEELLSRDDLNSQQRILAQKIAQDVGQAKMDKLNKELDVLSPSQKAEKNVGTTEIQEELPKAISSIRIIDKNTKGPGQEPIVTNLTKKSYVYEPELEQINGKVWYHGSTTSGLTKENIDPKKTNPHSLVGPGLYLTDSFNISAGYSKGLKRRIHEASRVYAVTVQVNKVLDFESNLKEYPEAELAFWKLIGDLEEVTSGTLEESTHLLSAEAQSGRHSTNSLLDIYELITFEAKKHTAFGKLPIQVLDEAFYQFNKSLREAGFDAVHHIGGQKAKSKVNHNVLVLLDPNGHLAPLSAATNPVKSITETRPTTALTLYKDPLKDVPFRDPNPDPIAELGNTKISNDLGMNPAASSVSSTSSVSNNVPPIPAQTATGVGVATTPPTGGGGGNQPPQPPFNNMGVNVPPNTPNNPYDAMARIDNRMVYAGEKGLHKTALPLIEHLRRISRAFEGAKGIEHAFQKAGKAGATTEEVINAGRLLAGNTGRRDVMLNDFLFIPEVTQPGQMSWGYIPAQGRTPKMILEDVGRDVERRKSFERLLIARRVLDSAIQNPPKSAQIQPGGALLTGISRQDAETTVQHLSQTDPQLAALADEWNHVLDVTAQYLQNAGSFSPAALQVWRTASANFVSLARLTNEHLTPETVFSVPKGGSDRILSPIETGIENIAAAIESAERNRFWRGMTDAYHADPNAFAGIIEEVRDPQLALLELTGDINQIKRNYLIATGQTMSDSEALELAVSLSNRALDADPNTKLVFRYSPKGGGTVRKYKLGPELKDFQKSLSAQEMSKIVSWAAKLSAPLRKGVSLGLDITGINTLLRDPLYLFLKQEYKFIPGVDTFRGFLENLQKGQYGGRYQAELAVHGGAFSARYGTPEQVADPKQLASIIPQDFKGKLKIFASGPLDYIQHAILPWSNSNRMGAYIRLRESGIEPQMAARMTRDALGGDWGQPGASKTIKGFVRATEFANVGFKSFGDYESILRKAISDPRYATGLMTRIFGSITLPVFINWYLNKDDEDIREYTASLGAGNLAFRLPGTDNVIAIPIPGYAFGKVFGTEFRAYLDKAYEDTGPDSQRGAIEALAKDLGVNYVPLPARVAIGLATNKDLRSDAPITPIRELQQMPADRATRMSSNFSRTIARAGEQIGLGWNPIYIDYALAQFLGTDGSKIFNSLDRMGQFDGISRPGMVMADVPLVGRFFPNIPSSSMGSVRDFYKEYQKTSAAMASLKAAEKDLNPDRLQYLVSHYADRITMAPMYATVAQQINKFYDLAHMYSNMPDDVLSPREKKEMVQELMGHIVDITRNFNTGMKLAQ